MRIVVMVQGGLVCGVYSNTNNVIVDVLDYDNITDDDDTTVEEVESEIEKGKLKLVW